MQPSILFALCVAFAASLYQVFQRQAAGINSYLVAIIVSGVAISLGLLFSIFGGKISITDLPQGKAPWFFLILIGLCAFGIDFFTSKAYTAGGSVSLIGPIVTSGIVILSGIFGAIFFKEPITVIRIGGILLMAVGIALASWEK